MSDLDYFWQLSNIAIQMIPLISSLFITTFTVNALRIWIVHIIDLPITSNSNSKDTLDFKKPLLLLVTGILMASIYGFIILFFYLINSKLAASVGGEELQLNLYKMMQTPDAQEGTKIRLLSLNIAELINSVVSYLTSLCFMAVDWYEKIILSLLILVAPLSFAWSQLNTDTAHDAIFTMFLDGFQVTSWPILYTILDIIFMFVSKLHLQGGTATQSFNAVGTNLIYVLLVLATPKLAQMFIGGRDYSPFGILFSGAPLLSKLIPSRK